MAYEFKTDSGLTFNFSRGNIQFLENEWYRLGEDTLNNQSGNIQLSSPFESAGMNIDLEFDLINWGGNALFDGWAIYLFDANAADAGTGGAKAGGMGYIDLKGAYIGIGTDSFGAFNAWVRTGTAVTPRLKNNVTVRGSQARDYVREATFELKKQLSSPSSTRQQAMDIGSVKHVKVTWVARHERPGYSIDMSINGEAIFENFDYPYAAPTSMKIGVSATTGGGRVNQEFRNVQVNFSKLPPKNLALGADAKIFVKNVHYPIPAPFLTDGDRVHVDWTSSGYWSGKLGTHATESGYMLDFLSTPIEINSVTIYFFQGEKNRVEPSDSTFFTYDGATAFELRLSKEVGKWVVVGTIDHNLKAKVTINFPTQVAVLLDVKVLYTNGKHADQRIYPVITEIEAFKL